MVGIESRRLFYCSSFAIARSVYFERLILSRMPLLRCVSIRQEGVLTTFFEYETFSDFTKWRLS